MKRKLPIIKEKHIESGILKFLQHKGVFAFKIFNGGSFDQSRGKFVFNHRTRTPGIADILGVYRGKAIAIEVKSKAGRVSEAQKHFLEQWIEYGGHACIARSLEDVARFLESLE